MSLADEALGERCDAHRGHSAACPVNPRQADGVAAVEQGIHGGVTGERERLPHRRRSRRIERCGPLGLERAHMGIFTELGTLYANLGKDVRFDVSGVQRNEDAATFTLAATWKFGPAKATEWTTKSIVPKVFSSSAKAASMEASSVTSA